MLGKYRKQRNLVSKLRVKATYNYFNKNCNDMSKKKILNTIKPFISQQQNIAGNCITLHEDGQVINEPSNICNIFTSHFVSLAKDIGKEGPINDDKTMQSIIETYQSHPSIKGHTSATMMFWLLISCQSRNIQFSRKFPSWMKGN